MIGLIVGCGYYVSYLRFFFLYLMPDGFTMRANSQIPLAEEFDMSVAQVKRIVYKNEAKIFNHI